MTTDQKIEIVKVLLPSHNSQCRNIETVLKQAEQIMKWIEGVPTVVEKDETEEEKREKHFKKLWREGWNEEMEKIKANPPKGTQEHIDSIRDKYSAANDPNNFVNPQKEVYYVESLPVSYTTTDGRYVEIRERQKSSLADQYTSEVLSKAVKDVWESSYKIKGK